MSTCEHQGRDTVLHTCLKIHWSRRSASSCFNRVCTNRVWRVTKSSAKHQSMLSPWVVQHQPWPSPSAWTKTRSLHGCRNFYLLILPSLSFCLSFCLSLLCAKMDFSRKKRKEKLLLCSHRHTTVIARPTCLIAHLLAPHDRGFSPRAHTHTYKHRRGVSPSTRHKKQRNITNTVNIQRQEP